MRKKFIGLAMTGMLLVTACGGSTATPVPATAAPIGGRATPAPATAAPAPITLTLRYCWGGEGEVKAMEKVIGAWNSANPDIQVTRHQRLDQHRGDRRGRGRRHAARHGDHVRQRRDRGLRPRRVIMPLDDILTADQRRHQQHHPGLARLGDLPGQALRPALRPGHLGAVLQHRRVHRGRPRPGQAAQDARRAVGLRGQAHQVATPTARSPSPASSPMIPDKNTEHELGALQLPVLRRRRPRRSPSTAQECVDWLNWYKKWYDTYNKKAP